MSGFSTMLKMNLKLLLRNKGYICFVFLLPLLSILLLNLPTNNYFDMGEDESYTIHEMGKDEKMALNMINTKLTIKVYDCSDSYLSDYVLQQLAKTGYYNIYRYVSDKMTYEEAEAEAIITANNNNIGAVLYIEDSFTDKVIASDEDEYVHIFEVAEDQRIRILNENLNSLLSSVERYAMVVAGDEEEIEKLTRNALALGMEKNIVDIEVGNQSNLTKVQQAQSYNLGYSLAVVSIGFLFGGVFIATIFVEEKQNRVLKRIMLTNANSSSYGGVKIILAIITVFIQVVVMGIGIRLFVKTDFGIPLSSYLLFIFCLGLIFNLLSVVVGVITDNVLSASYTSFFVWCLSAMLGGLYFPLESGSMWDKFSLLTPQRWVVKSTEMLMAGETGVYVTYLLATCGFLAVIMSIGILGIKLSKKE